jgi:hypothetical protein
MVSHHIRKPSPVLQPALSSGIPGSEVHLNKQSSLRTRSTLPRPISAGPPAVPQYPERRGRSVGRRAVGRGQHDPYHPTIPSYTPNVSTVVPSDSEVAPSIMYVPKQDEYHYTRGGPLTSPFVPAETSRRVRSKRRGVSPAKPTAEVSDVLQCKQEIKRLQAEQARARAEQMRAASVKRNHEQQLMRQQIREAEIRRRQEEERERWQKRLAIERAKLEELQTRTVLRGSTLKPSREPTAIHSQSQSRSVQKSGLLPPNSTSRSASKGAGPRTASKGKPKAHVDPVAMLSILDELKNAMEESIASTSLKLQQPARGAQAAHQLTHSIDEALAGHEGPSRQPESSTANRALPYSAANYAEGVGPAKESLHKSNPPQQAIHQSGGDWRRAHGGNGNGVGGPSIYADPIPSDSASEGSNDFSRLERGYWTYSAKLLGQIERSLRQH